MQTIPFFPYFSFRHHRSCLYTHKKDKSHILRDLTYFLLKKKKKQQNIINEKMDSAKRVNIHIEKAHNFMRQFRDPESRELKKLSANQFMDVWSHYDKDGKYIFKIFK